MDWKNHWNKFPAQFSKNDFLKQVGKTVQGQPISEEQLSAIVSDLIQKLDLVPEDRVLDLCCGNGLITSLIASHCQYVVGVDYSKPLIEIAREYNQRANTSYLNMSIMDITYENLQISGPFTKIYMYESLQYFQENDLSRILESLIDLSGDDPVILFTSVPDKARVFKFYDTPERQREYRIRMSAGTEALGTWWRKSVIRRGCEALGLKCEFMGQPAGSHTAHYRFDVRISRR